MSDGLANSYSPHGSVTDGARPMMAIVSIFWAISPLRN
jgi:hypothetical protein